MIREEAIRFIDAIKRGLKSTGKDYPYRDEYIPKMKEACEDAIKALEILEEFEKAQIITGGRLNGRTYAYKCGLEDGKRKALREEPCDDCVSRQAAIDALNKTSGIRGDALKALYDLPPVAPQPKMGHWIIKIKSDLRGGMWPTNPKCSECGGEPYYSNTIYNYKFCPYCGAKMESEDK